jgi:hypothetical protein
VAVTDPQETLAYHLSRPLSQPRDMRAIDVASVAQAMKLFMDADTVPQTVPETEALWFYAMNHGMAEIRQTKALYEPLGAMLPFVNDYYRILSPKAVRAFYYMLLICTREARHLHAAAKLEAEVVGQFGDVAWAWTKAAIGEQAVQEKLLNVPPSMSFGDYVGALRYVFYHGQWSSGYGGKAWGSVADCLCRFVYGQTTAEMMLDTVWTLAHNNGPIFNKGQFYCMYSQELLKILDVQAAGQVHEFILHDPHGPEYAPGALKQQVQWVADNFGGVGNYVDWYLVEALGAKHAYGAEKALQAKTHGISDSASAAEKAALKKQQEAKALACAAALQAAALEAKTWFQVMPGLKVPKITRAAMAA